MASGRASSQMTHVGGPDGFREEAGKHDRRGCADIERQRPTVKVN